MLSTDTKKKIGTAALLMAAAATVTTVVFAAGSPTGGGMSGGAPGGAPGGQSSGQMQVAEKAASVISVKLAQPTRGEMVRNTAFIGKIEAAESVSVYPETSGKVTAVYYDAGDYVQAGELLMTLDTSDLEFDLQVAEASYDEKVLSAEKTLGSDYTSKLVTAQNSLDKANRSYRSARQTYAQEIDSEDSELADLMEDKDLAWTAYQDAQSEWTNSGEGRPSDLDSYSPTEFPFYEAMMTKYEAYQKAADQYYNATDDYDTSTSGAAVSKDNAYKDVLQAQESLELATGSAYEEQKAVIESQLKSAQLSLQKAERALDKAYLYAPMSGVIESRSINTFEMASGNTAAFTISNQDGVQVLFNASSDGAAALEIGDEVTIAKGEASYTANITEIDSKADSATGLFPVTATVVESDGRLLAGVSVTVSAATRKEEDALMIPLDVLYYDDGDAYVFTYVDGKAVRQDVVTGLSDADTVAVTEGLSEQSYVITNWHPDLADGAAVGLSDQATQLLQSNNVLTNSDVSNHDDVQAPAEGGLTEAASSSEKAASEEAIPAASGEAAPTTPAPAAPNEAADEAASAAVPAASDAAAQDDTAAASSGTGEDA